MLSGANASECIYGARILEMFRLRAIEHHRKTHFLRAALTRQGYIVSSYNKAIKITTRSCGADVLSGVCAVACVSIDGHAS